MRQPDMRARQGRAYGPAQGEPMVEGRMKFGNLEKGLNFAAVLTTSLIKKG
jgi:hypothetical protein